MTASFLHNVIGVLGKNLLAFRDRNAFCINGNFYSYGDLSQAVSGIRKRLAEERIEKSLLGLVCYDDIETYAAIIALWFEGFAYVPLHPGQPAERNNEIIRNAELEYVLSSSEEQLYPVKKQLLTRRLEADPKFAPFAQVRENELAYMLFTSGSTGKPKGVPISRKNLATFISSFGEIGFEMNADDRCLQCFDLSFDVSVQSFLFPLLSGACVYTIPHDQIKWAYIYGLFEDEELTFAIMAPSMIRFLQPYFEEIDAASLRYCIVTAEASPVSLIEAWSKCIPNARIFNFYGPTEATIYCTCLPFKPNEANKQLNGMLAIGKAMEGNLVRVLDDRNQEVEAGEFGELCIGGDQLTSGYWKLPDRNRSSFIDIDIEGEATRFYKTGDSCCMDSDGDIIYAGRLDNQVKIQGYRIEPGEIEYCAREFLGANAVAIALEKEPGIMEIALCFEGTKAGIASLKDHLSQKLPGYMVPFRYRSVSSIPLNTNGKTDRKAVARMFEIED